MTNTIHGTPVKTVKMHGRDYAPVAERSRFVHEAFGEDGMLGYEVTGRDVFSLGDRHFITVYIEIKGRKYCGASEIKIDKALHKLKENDADAKNPIECAETSAVGRALAFAGIGVVDDLASADEMIRAGVRPDETPAKPHITPVPRAGGLIAAPKRKTELITLAQIGTFKRLCRDLEVEPPPDLPAWEFTRAAESIMKMTRALKAREHAESEAAQ